MADALLIIFTIIFSIIMLGLSIYLLIIYCHPDEVGLKHCLFYKIVIITGGILVWGFVLILPLDIANSRGSGGELNIELLYFIVFILYFIFVTFLLPMTILFYESDDDDNVVKRFFSSLMYELIILVIIGLLALIAWGTMRTAELNDL